MLPFVKENKECILLRLELRPQGSKNQLQNLNPNQNYFDAKNSVHIATFNIWTFNRIGQLPELTPSVAEHNIDILCIHWYYYSKLAIKYNDTGIGWTVVSKSAWKNSISSIIGGLGMLLSPRAQKWLNSIEKIQPRIMVAIFDGNPCTSIISCYSPTNVSNETDLTIFYNELSFLVHIIPKHNILIIGGDMNAQIHKDQNNKFCLHNSSNRNVEHLRDFSFESRQTCLNTKFKKRVGKPWTYTYQNNAISTDRLHYHKQEID